VARRLAPDVGSLAVGAAALGVGGLLQAAVALRVVRAHRVGLAAQGRTLAVTAGAVAVYPLAFYSSMRLAGVAVGTVVSIGSGSLAAALIERVVDHRPLWGRPLAGTATHDARRSNRLLALPCLRSSRAAHGRVAAPLDHHHRAGGLVLRG